MRLASLLSVYAMRVTAAKCLIGKSDQHLLTPQPGSTSQQNSRKLAAVAAEPNQTISARVRRSVTLLDQ
jgi:hypothetical protein